MVGIVQVLAIHFNVIRIDQHPKCGNAKYRADWNDDQYQKADWQEDGSRPFFLTNEARSSNDRRQRHQRKDHLNNRDES